jgi:subtilisin family serine protease
MMAFMQAHGISSGRFRRFLPEVVVVLFGVLSASGCLDRESADSLAGADPSPRTESEPIEDDSMALPTLLLESGHSLDPPDWPYAPIVPGMVVVLHNNQYDLEDINEANGTSTAYYLEGCDYVALNAPSGVNLWDLCENLVASGCTNAEPFFVTEAPESNQGTIPFYEGDHIPSDVFDQDALTRIGIADAHSITTGEGVLVAVLDTGVDATHPDLSSSISSEGYDFFDEDADPTDVADGIDQDNDGLVDEGAGHGTHVAGIIHAVAPGATILPIRVLNSEGTGTSVAVARGIRHAMARGAKVINLSLGMDVAPAVIRDAIHDAWFAEVVIVASAGNRGIEDTNHYPAKENKVMSVAATDAVDWKATFSNYGPKVDLCAPGEGILSTFLNHGYAVWSGTSMSTPMVSGAAALRIDLSPGDDADEIVDAIEDSSLELDFDGEVFDGKLGRGRLDLSALANFEF